jgi:Ca2+-binding EF-hand superfamily protein
MDYNLIFIREVFNIFDKESEGSILIKDLVTICKFLFRVPLTDIEIIKLFNIENLESDLKIKFEDFYLTLHNKEIAIKESSIEEAFHRFDKKGIGKISKLDLKSIIESEYSGLTSEEINEIIEQFSLNSNEEIDYNKLIEDYFSKSVI